MTRPIRRRRCFDLNFVLGSSPSHVTNGKYELIYWPTIQGRGEFIRLALEEANAPYDDVARRSEEEGGGFRAVIEVVRGRGAGHPVLAPPILRYEELVVSQTSNILAWVGSRHGLWPRIEPDRLHAMQLLLTIADLVMEAHDTHHPVVHDGYYEDQREAAAIRARHFVDARMPKFLLHFEDVLEVNGGVHIVGETLTTVDVALFQLLEGLEYAFPKGFARASNRTPKLHALRDRVRQRPRLATYLSSSERIPFNEHGIFRRYPELDLEAGA